MATYVIKFPFAFINENMYANSKSQSKAQSAMEFLITYGWAFLIIGVVLAALYALGLFNTNAFGAKSTCLLNNFLCKGLTFATNGLLIVNLESINMPVNVIGIACNEQGTLTNVETLNGGGGVLMAVGSNYTFAVSCYTGQNTVFSGSAGDYFDGYLVVNTIDEATATQSVDNGTLAVSAQ